MRVFLNGQIVPQAEAHISMDDRGFLFADAVYEVIHVYGSHLFAWDLHMTRLAEGMQELGYGPVDLGALKTAAETLVSETGAPESSVYIQISRGVQPRSHLFPPAGTPSTVLLWVRPLTPFPPELVRQGVDVITVADDRWAKVWIKTVGLLPNVLAKQAAHERAAFDALFVRDGIVTEATSANVFIVRQGRLQTAPVTNYILPGITRQVVLDLAATMGLDIDLRPFVMETMLHSDEVFLTGTLTEVMPIRKVDGHLIASVGPVSQRLLAALHDCAGHPGE